MSELLGGGVGYAQHLVGLPLSHSCPIRNLAVFTQHTHRGVHERSGKRMFKVLSAPHCMEFKMVDTDLSVPAFICWVMCDGGRIPGVYKMMCSSTCGCTHVHRGQDQYFSDVSMKPHASANRNVSRVPKQTICF